MTDIYYGADLTEDVRREINSCAMVVTDGNVAELYSDLCDGAFVIESGEGSKCVDTLFSVIAEMLRRGLSRTDTVCALGGGVVGDVTGLAAALYKRGIDWVSVPTTLLAMVDSGQGGKTGIDLGGIKNAVGTFHRPKSEYVSYKFLDTLPPREWLCGLGETVKTCVLTHDSYTLLKDNFYLLKAHDRSAVYKLIENCFEIKRAVVAADPKDAGMRKILNVGHTVGHALESADGYKLSHGEYVLKGMLTELAMCKDIVDKRFYAELTGMLTELVRPPRTTGGSVLKYALNDKKNVGNMITIMLPVSGGEINEVRLDSTDFLSRYDNALKEFKRA